MENDPGSLQERIDKLERDLLVTMTAVRTFVSASPASSKKPSLFGKFFEKVLIPLIPGLIMFAVGYVMIESVKQDLEERKAQSANAAQVQPLLKGLLGKEMAAAEEAYAAALSLAGYGRYAVLPLLNVLESGGETRISAARKGLIAAGYIENDYVCRVLVDAIDDRTRLYSWLSHKQLIEIIGLLNCRQAAESFHRYEGLLNTPEAEFRSAVDTEGVSDNDLPNKMGELRRTLILARSRLRPGRS